jgi:hypothetical protein
MNKETLRGLLKMNTKKSLKKQARKGSEEARSRMLTMISGQKGPLPIDNDQRIQQESAERTSDEMRDLGCEKRPQGHT